jgi:hypothetical protein
MATEMLLRVYGENAATFLIFQALALCPEGVTLLLTNLKRFDSGKTKEWDTPSNAQVWLFPSFGKRHGFGEPDALILVDDQVFWIEVETTINCQTGLPALRRALVQLWRFRLFQQALAAGSQIERGARRISGQTLTDSRVVRRASVRIAGHGVLQQIRDQLAAAGTRDTDHYVLFTADQPAGEGSGWLSYAQVLERERKQLSIGYQEDLARLPDNRCWYAYWKGDLESKFNDRPDSRLMLDETYVRIRRPR